VPPGPGSLVRVLSPAAGAPIARYAERMTVENELDAYISEFHLDALTSSVPLNVDLDTALTVIAGNLCRLLARKLPATKTEPPTRSGGTSWTPPEPSASPATTSPAP
jgi:hypothetical protein